MAAPLINSSHVLIDDIDSVAEVIDNNTEAYGADSIFTIVDAYTSGGYGWLPSNAAVRSNRAHATSNDTLSGTMLDDGAEFRGGSSIDGSAAAGGGKRLFYTHHYSSQGSALNNVANVANEGYGYMFFLFSDSTGSTSDRTANVRGWCSGGRDTVPTLFAPTPTSFIAVDPTYTDNAVPMGSGSDQLTHIDVVTSGNEFDPANIESVGWGTVGNNTTAGANVQTISRLGYYDEYTFLEGESSNPCGYDDLYDATQSEQHYAMAIGDGEQYRCRCAIEFGDAALLNTRPVYFAASNGSINFATKPSSLTAPLVRPYHADDNKIGLEEQLRSGDTVTHTNYQLSSGTPWHLRMASTAGATVTFSNCVIQNAGGTDDDCEIDSDVTIDGGLIDQCGKLSVNGGTIKNLTVSNPTNTTALDITESSSLQNIAFSTNLIADHAIEIPDPGGTTDAYNFDNLTFSGFDYPVLVQGSTGTVNINILNGGDTPEVYVGTPTHNPPTLEGAGWADGTAYTAEAGGGNTRRAVIVVASNNGSKLPDGVTFGGSSMTSIVSNLQGAIGLSLWYIVETGNTSIFTGSQTIAATWTGGTPSSVTFQAATYDDVKQSTLEFQTDFSGNSTAGATSNLDDWSSTDEINSLSFPVSSGTSRLLIAIVNHEDNGGSPGPTGVDFGDQAMTLIGTVTAGTLNSSSMYYLNESGISAATGNTIIANGTVGDTPSLAAASFQGVNQAAPIKDSATATGSNPASGSVLEIDDGDIVVGSFASSGGSNSSALTGELTPADSSFAENIGDDPSEGAYKGYSGSSTTTGAAGWTGGDGTRTASVFAVIASGGTAGNLSTSVTAADESLVISAAQTESTTPFGITFGGDVTERDEVSASDRRVAVADYTESAGPASVSATITDTTTVLGSYAQIVTSTIPPFTTFSGGPTVNVNASVNITITAQDIDGNAIENARVYLRESGGGSQITTGLTNASGVYTDTYSSTLPQAVEGWVRKSSSSPYYKEFALGGSITTDGYTTTAIMNLDE